MLKPDERRQKERFDSLLAALHGIHEQLHSLVRLLNPTQKNEHPVSSDDTSSNEHKVPGPQATIRIIRQRTDAEIHQDEAARQSTVTFNKRTLTIQWFLVGATLLAVFAAAYYACIAKKQLISSQRAFVSFKPASLNMLISETVFTRFPHMWYNSGPTPTKRAVETAGFMVWSSGGIAKDSDFERAGTVSRNIIVRPKESPIIAVPWVSEADLNMVRREEARLFFWGSIVYEDIFEGTLTGTPKRLTEFCVVVANWEPRIRANTFKLEVLTWRYDFCPTHNCYDEKCPDYNQRTEAAWKQEPARIDPLSSKDNVASASRGGIAITSPEDPHYPRANLNDDSDAPWGSDQTLNDIYAAIELPASSAIREFRIQLYSAAQPPRSHLRDIRVFAADNPQEAESPKRFIRSRLAADQSFSQKLTVPQGEDGQIVRVEIDTRDPNYGKHKIWGFACLKGDQCNYLPPRGGLGMYVRELQMK